MNAGTVSGVITALLLLLFIGGWMWVWSSRRTAEFSAAARMALDDDEPHSPATAEQQP